MSKYKMISPAVPNVPWQEGPETFTGAPVWRYSENPVIGRNPLKNVARIFNSAVMPYEDGFIGVFRGEQNNGIQAGEGGGYLLHHLVSGFLRRCHRHGENTGFQDIYKD